MWPMPTRKSGKKSAGILLYRMSTSEPQFLLGHPGGPFYAKKDLGAWVIPKGEILASESAEDAARREFREETGFLPEGELRTLGEADQGSGKRVVCFALEFTGTDEWLAENFSPGNFLLEWPPKSGKETEFPEIDRVRFFSISEARQKILRSQEHWLERLLALIDQ